MYCSKRRFMEKVLSRAKPGKDFQRRTKKSSSKKAPSKQTEPIYRFSLTLYEIVHEFIDRILVYELDKDTNTRKVEIYYSFVGQVDTGEAHTESVSFFRQIGADVKSYAV